MIYRQLSLPNLKLLQPEKHFFGGFVIAKIPPEIRCKFLAKLLILVRLLSHSVVAKMVLFGYNSTYFQWGAESTSRVLKNPGDASIRMAQKYGFTVL
jgi:hypothetical protein